MDDKKIAQILNTVKKLTTQKKINWSKIEDGMNETYTAKVFEYEISLLQSSLYVYFRVTKDKKELGSVSDSLFSSGTIDQYDLWSFIAEVRRKVEGIDDGLDDLLGKLNTIK